jgi:hypothetical protein
MNPFKDIVQVERGGKVFTLHWRYRFGPIAGIASSIMPFVGPGLQIAGMVGGFGGSRQEAGAIDAQAEAIKQQAANEAQILENNAQLKERQGERELERARKEAILFGKEGEKLKGRQRVSIAKGGVLTTVGSATTVFEQTAMDLAADRREILREGFDLQEFRLAEAENLRFQGRSAIARGENLAQGLYQQADGTRSAGMGSLLSGVGPMLPSLSKLGGSLFGGSTGVSSLNSTNASSFKNVMPLPKPKLDTLSSAGVAFK